jgi:hypothetical protein
MPGLAGNFEKFTAMKKAKGKKAMPPKMKGKAKMPKGKGGKVPRGSALDSYDRY